MIVKKRWTTEKREDKPSGFGQTWVTRNWYGIYLFGFIPLWIENTSTEYQR